MTSASGTRLGACQSLCGLFMVQGLLAADPSNSLSALVLFARPVLEMEAAAEGPSANPCAAAYLKAVPRKSILRQPMTTAAPGKVLARRRQNLEAQMVLLLGPAAQAEARRFAQSLPLGYEWEGLSEGPLHEADCAKQWLAKYPGTPIAAFLHLFMAHRLRAGFEAASRGHEKGLLPILARRYREQLDLARKGAPALLRCVADDLEAQSHVYLEGFPLP